jgi:diguanylate cyclase (GGDEF)-like protein
VKDIKRVFLFLPIALLLGFVLYLVSRFNYVLFHVTLEFFIVLIGILIFTVTVLAKRFAQPSFLTRLGPGILVSSMITFLHLLTYKGMNIITGYDANLPTQLWVILNIIFSVSILFAMLDRKGRVSDRWTLLGYLTAGVTAVVLSFERLFPVCFVVGTGLTPFKRYVEYAVILVLLASLLLLDRWKRGTDERLRRYMVATLILLILSEFLFTLYSDVYGLANFAGHYLRLLAFFLIYLSIVVEGIQRPYKLIFSELNDLSFTDGLTHLHNHRYLLESIERLRVQSLTEGKELYLLVFDVDRFKEINDGFGHTVGDEVLKEVADTIRRSIRSTDVACRQGGDEFAVVLYDVTADFAHAIVDRLRKDFLLSPLNSRGVRLTVSGGAVRFDGESTQELLSKADHLLYAAKRDGRNRFYFCNDEDVLV